MIVKSMARKSASFGQLIRYFDQGQELDESGRFTRNLYASDRKAVEREFEQNHRYLPKRSNGNALYHEIIVLDQGAKVSPQAENRILIDLAERYCAARAPHQLVYGRIHDDKAHRHIHLMISANRIKSPRRVRLEKSRFSDIQKELETYLLERYPEIGATRIYTRSRELERARVANREGELERRTGRPSKKRRLREVLQHHFEKAISKADLERRLKEEKLRLYQRGRQIGVEPLDEGRRFRLKTLGLELLYQQMLTRLETERDREKSLLQIRDAQANALARERAGEVEKSERAEQAEQAEHSQSTELREQIGEAEWKERSAEESAAKSATTPPVHKNNQKSTKRGREAELLQQRADQERFAQEHLRDFEGER